MPEPRNAQSILVIAPHADDEVLGAGGIIHKTTLAGGTARVIFLAVDGFHHYGLDKETTLDERMKEIEKVSEIMGYEYEIVYKGKDMIERLDTLPQRDLVEIFEKKYNDYQPDLLILPHGIDFDQDHIACFRAAFAAARPIPESTGKFLPKRVMTCEQAKLVWSQESFQPNMYCDISGIIEKKLEAIAAYKTQLRKIPHLRSLKNIKGLARLRGSQVGVKYAEAFHILRWLT